MIHLLLLLMPLCLTEITQAQPEWQSYQLTDFPPPMSVREYSSVADSFGSVHHYFYSQVHPLNPRHDPLYYMRTDFSGNVLTDTVHLNSFAGGNPFPRCIRAMGDGEHNWCMFTEYADSAHEVHGVFLTKRGSDGVEVMAPTYVADDEWEDWEFSSAFDPITREIHLIGGVSDFPCHYYRFTTAAETLQWGWPVDSLTVGSRNPSMVLCPADGRPWTSIAAGSDQAGWHPLIIRFNQDSSQTTFSPPVSFGGNLLGIDMHRNSDYIAGNDTARLIYFRLDSTFQNMIAYRTLSLHNPGYAHALKTDSIGNCLIVWSTSHHVYWAYRRSDGQWIPPPTEISSEMTLYDISIVLMDSAQFAFTAIGYQGYSDWGQARLYTFGLPPSAAAPRPVVPIASTMLTASPNPFNASTTITFTLSSPSHVRLAVYDVLGQEVKTVVEGMQEAGRHEVALSVPELASGVYFLRLVAAEQTRTAKLMILK